MNNFKAGAVTKEDCLASVPVLARQAVETFVMSGVQLATPVNLAESLSRPGACFVSIKTRTGDLRGCIGTIEPTKETLADEVITNAINAATRDPRFPPVSTGELPNLVYSVDILAAPEPASLQDLDPSVYGVIVEDETGYARGLLLPDIAGVNTVAQQVEIAARKAGIAPGKTLKLSRFRVERFRE